MRALDRATVPPSRSKQILRAAIHLLSYHFILKRCRTTLVRVAGEVGRARHCCSNRHFSSASVQLERIRAGSTRGRLQ